MATNPVYTVTKFDVGGIWEEDDWELHNNERVSLWYGERIQCPHIELLPEAEDGNTHFVPRVLVIKNEGGHNSTGLCLDCVLEQLLEGNHA